MKSAVVAFEKVFYAHYSNIHSVYAIVYYYNLKLHSWKLSVDSGKQYNSIKNSFDNSDIYLVWLTIALAAV